MTALTMDEDAAIRPLLLRLCQPLRGTEQALRYDRQQRLNVLAANGTPAVAGAVEVKTIGVSAED